jgi:uncharacterized membrane protein (TIGR02234 family)
MAERRRTFAPVVLAGLASAALAAVAGGKDWLAVHPGSDASAVPVSPLSVTAALGSPLAAGLALVVLACWGVVLVTRGRFRRAVAWLGVLAGVGYAVTTVAAPWTLREDATDEIFRTTAQQPDIGLTAWWWAALVAAVLVVATTVLAALLVPRWPEMASRYDAPADASPEVATDGVDGAGPSRGSVRDSNIDLWKALDEGRDPTA